MIDESYEGVLNDIFPDAFCGYPTLECINSMQNVARSKMVIPFLCSMRSIDRKSRIDFYFLRSLFRTTNQIA